MITSTAAFWEILAAFHLTRDFHSLSLEVVHQFCAYADGLRALLIHRRRIFLYIFKSTLQSYKLPISQKKGCPNNPAIILKCHPAALNKAFVPKRNMRPAVLCQFARLVWMILTEVADLTHRLTEEQGDESGLFHLQLWHLLHAHDSKVLNVLNGNPHILKWRKTSETPRAVALNASNSNPVLSRKRWKSPFSYPNTHLCGSLVESTITSCYFELSNCLKHKILFVLKPWRRNTLLLEW